MEQGSEENNAADISTNTSNDRSRPESPFHPIHHFAEDGESLNSCLDMINRVSYFVALLNHISVGEESDSGDGGLTPHATTAYRNMITMLYESVRFISVSLTINNAEQVTKTTDQARQHLNTLNKVTGQLNELIGQSDNQPDATVESASIDGVSHPIKQLLHKLRSAKTLLNEVTDSLSGKAKIPSGKAPKISFRPYHGTPFKKYSIFCQNHLGTIKHIGNMMAPNDDLALAKAKENFVGTIEKGATLFVKQR